MINKKRLYYLLLSSNCNIFNVTKNTFNGNKYYQQSFLPKVKCKKICFKLNYSSMFYFILTKWYMIQIKINIYFKIVLKEKKKLNSERNFKKDI